MTELAPGELALRFNVLRSTAVYAAYIVEPRLADVIDRLVVEFRVLDPRPAITVLSPIQGERLVFEVVESQDEIVIVDARNFVAKDWALIDRRRSSIAHRGLLLLVTTGASFAELMQHAPNLASWLGGEVFAHPYDADAVTAASERRLAELRAWANLSNEDVVAEALAGRLPRDPEYAEWLVLLGRSDLLGPGRS